MELKVDNISKYVDGKYILNGVSFLLKNAECLALIGPNGAGKTSIIRSILGIYELTDGNIFLDGQPIGSKGYIHNQKKVAAVLDNLGLYRSLTAWENVEFFDRLYFPICSKHERHIRIAKSLETFDLYDYRDQKITFFSKGMKQRLALARALIKNPSLLILDEPFQGLDIDGSLLLRDYILEMKKNGVSIIISSHNLLILEKLCDEFAFIKDGKCIKHLNRTALNKELASNFYAITDGTVINSKIIKLGDHLAYCNSGAPDENIRRLNPEEVDIELLYKAIMESSKLNKQEKY